MIEATRPAQLEILSDVMALGFCIVERVRETRTLDRLLFDAVHLSWRCDTGHFVERGCYVDDVLKLRA
jgi:hypothetical protein